MNWNLFNTVILSAALFSMVVSLLKQVYYDRNETASYLRWFIILGNLSIVQLILVDIGAAQKHPYALFLLVPFHFVSPVLFTAFTFSYLNSMAFFKKHLLFWLVPFVLSLLLYAMVKITMIADIAVYTENMTSYLNYEWDETLAVSFALMAGMFNYKAIQNYESQLGDLPYKMVARKTKWLKFIYSALVLLCLFWMVTLLYARMNESSSGLWVYYPLLISFLAFFFCFCFLGSKHLHVKKRSRDLEKQTLRKVSNDFQLSGLNRVFTSDELGTSETVQYETTAILGYFATSLFDKTKEEDILWDITKNCIAKLNLEDCVIYMLDEKRQVLVQKAAYGNKDKGERKILSPIEIKMGEGIVGHVADTGKLQVVSNTLKDQRYILDDRQRQSELSVPITHGATLIGVLDSEHSKQDFFKEKHIFLFRLIAKLIAAKLAQVVKKSSLQLTNDNAYYQELCRLLNSEKIYRDPELSLTSVAERLSISSTYLSQLVNQCNEKNFSEFINSYRVRDAEYMLMDSDFSNYTILSIGLEAGFNSKSTFYTAFKKYTGVTPTQYRENRLLVS